MLARMITVDDARAKLAAHHQQHVLRFFETLDDAGKARLELATPAGMTDTRAFYRHLGWQQSGRAGRAVFFSKPL